MKTVSLTQPWATLVAIGAKCFETRSWGTNYRGPLGIHAAKGFPRWAIDSCFHEPFSKALTLACIKTPADLPRGAVIAIVDLVGCWRTEVVLADGRIGVDEYLFGDYGPRRFAWELANVRALSEPVPARGALGLWEWENPTAPPAEPTLPPLLKMIEDAA